MRANTPHLDSLMPGTRFSIRSSGVAGWDCQPMQAKKKKTREKGPLTSTLAKERERERELTCEGCG